MQLPRVAVLRGGPSEEYEVSMKTGASVLNAIDPARFTPIDVVVTKQGEWLVGGYGRYPEQVLSHIDVVFNALHGTFGEDGTVQRILDRSGVRYTGSRAFPSRIAMHKLLTKDALRDLGVKMAPHMLVSESARHDPFAVANRIAELFGPEYVIKPVTSGSSVGTMMVGNSALLPQALKDALDTYDQVLVEKRIRGKEATCGVVSNFREKPLYTLPPIEIVPQTDFFDYSAKYGGSTEEICPGRFSEKEKRELEELASRVHDTLDLRHYSRSDFIIGEDTSSQAGGIYFLEVNTLPGLTEQSLFPKALAAVGVRYQDFITHLLTEALER